MNRTNRQLAAIMFTDIVGYTALMGEDEQQALQLLRKNRTLHKSIIKKHNGKWLKEMGDGTLASFKTISDAVYCAGELIKSCSGEDIELRIGIHFGEVTEEGGDIFGDGVNVASRLEPLAQPGQILVSGVIHRNVKNQQGIRSAFIEEKQLKNVDEPVKIYAVEVEEHSDTNQYDKPHAISKSPKSFISKPLITGLITVLVVILGIFYFVNPFGVDKSASDNLKNKYVHTSIAVLPFSDMSSEQDQEYLGDGIAEEIINRLTRVEDLKVIGRTSSFSFKNKETDLKTIGEMLGVETILEGSVQKSGNQLRITAQLINAKDGSHFWSKRFDREFSNIFSIQDELAHLVVTKMLDDSANENRIVYNDENINSEAYEYYLKGYDIHLSKYLIYNKLKDFYTAEKLFFKALEVDPNYVLVHAGLADLYNTRTVVSKDDPLEKQKYLELQKKHILIGYQLDPSSDYVNQAKGHFHLVFEEYDSAYKYFIKAVQLNPNNSSNIYSLAGFLDERGLYKIALILYDKAKEIDPLELIVLGRRAETNMILGNWGLSMDDYDDIILIEPNLSFPHERKMNILIAMGKVNEAQEILTKCKENFPESDFSFFEGVIYAARGDKENALKINKDIGWYYALWGMKEEYIKAELKYLTRLSNENISQYLRLINKNQYYEWIKDDPRVQEFVKKEKEKYDRLLAKYGNLDFLNL